MQQFLKNKSTSSWQFLLWGTLAAFCTYTCMSALRRGITATTFDGLVFWGISFKIWLVITQVFGYGAAKGVGVKVISEMRPERRARNLLIFAAVAMVAMLGFALVPAPYNIIFLFFNGFATGLVYGTMLGFLEGRKQTDVLVAGLTSSFIFASGLTKDVGRYLLSMGVSEFWLPFSIGLIFALPLVVSVWALNQLPPPTPDDQAARTKRSTMSGEDRQQFIHKFSAGLVLFIVSYVILSIVRDFRDNFGPEILRSAGGGNALIFTKTETIVSICILLMMASLRWVTDNWQAFKIVNGLMLLGVLLVGGSTWAFEQQWLSGGVWFTVVGVGLYLAYVPCNGLYFERFVASFQYVSTVGFVVTLSDFYAYMGSISILLYKNFGQPDISFLDFFIKAAYLMAALYALLIVVSFLYFRKKFEAENQQMHTTITPTQW